MQAPEKSDFTLRHVLAELARDIYDAQCELLNFIAELDDGIENPELHDVLAGIALGTRSNLADLEAICEDLGVPPTGVKCEAMEGLLREAKDTSQQYDLGSTKDAALIAIARRITHYEIASFDTAKTFANKLKLPKIADLFGGMLARANDNDKSLVKVAKGSWLKGGINDMAAKKDLE